jgi:hypothetical protein
VVAIVGARSTRLLLCTTTGLSLCSFRLIPASTRGEGNSAQAINTRGRLKSQNRQGLLSSTSGCRSASGPCRERRQGSGLLGASAACSACCLLPDGHGRLGKQTSAARNAPCALCADLRPEWTRAWHLATRSCSSSSRMLRLGARPVAALRSLQRCLILGHVAELARSTWRYGPLIVGYDGFTVYAAAGFTIVRSAGGCLFPNRGAARRAC